MRPTIRRGKPVEVDFILIASVRRRMPSDVVHSLMVNPLHFRLMKKLQHREVLKDTGMNAKVR
jgi:hypothetical protein